MKKYIIFSLLFLTVLPKSYASVPEQRKVQNLKAFCKLFGLTYYFHPSDEAQKIRWAGFAILGVQKVINCENDEQLIDTLAMLFKPIAPSVSIYATASGTDFDSTALIPTNGKYNFTYWQHLGINAYTGNSIYSSLRVNKRSLIYQPSCPSRLVRLGTLMNHDHVSGKRYVLSFTITNNSEDCKDYQEVGIMDSDDEASTFIDNKVIMPGEVKEVHYSSTFKTDAKTILFNLLLQIPQTQKVSITNAKLQIAIAHDSLETFLLKDSGYTKSTVPEANLTIPVRNSVDPPLFSRSIKFSETTSEELVPGVSCVVPLGLYSTSEGTFPSADREKLESLVKEIRFSVGKLDQNGELRCDKLEVRIANVIILSNILRHSFPYWDDAGVSPEDFLDAAIQRALSEQNEDEFLQNIRQLASPLNDGHLFVQLYKSQPQKESSIPLIFSKIKKEIIVKAVLDETFSPALRPGDVILEINRVPVQTLFENKLKDLSGSQQWKEHLALTRLGNGSAEKEVEILVKRGLNRFRSRCTRSYPAVYYRQGAQTPYTPKTGWIDSATYYFNLTTDTLVPPTFAGKIGKARKVIFDLRGYPNSSQTYESLLPMLIKQELRDSSRLFTPQIIYPNFRDVSFKADDAVIKRGSINIAVKIVLLCDASAQSASETLLSRIKDFNLATIVGSPSSGTNGNINTVSLLGGLQVSFSGMLVKNADGSRHHLVGVIPDILVKETKKGIRRKQDEILEEALDLK